MRDQYVQKTKLIYFDSHPFKITDFVTTESPCDFLLVININLPPILHRFQFMAHYLSNFP